MGGFTSGNAIGLVLSPILMSQAGIFGPFVIFGLSGFLWVLVWLSATSSTPDRHPQISKYELEYILREKQKPLLMGNKHKPATVIPPFRRLLSKMPTWSIIVANAMHSWVMHAPLSLVFLKVMFKGKNVESYVSREKFSLSNLLLLFLVKLYLLFNR